MTARVRTPESVWDYPRPPRLELDERRVEIWFDGRKIADSSATYRVLETSHPPTFYVPRGDVLDDALEPSSRRSFCEWKGNAVYFDVVGEQSREPNGAWSYPRPTLKFAEIRDYVSFYPGRMDRCLVGGEEVEAQKGDFYGGWITSEIQGPFKGGRGTAGW